VNVIAFFSLHDRLERRLAGRLHPLARGEKLVTLFFDVRVLEHHGVFHGTVSRHRSERKTIFVHIHASDCIRIVLASDVMSLVRDGYVQSPLVVFVNDFSCSNSPLVIAEGSPQAVEVGGASTKFACDVGPSCRSDTESNRIRILDKETIAFSVVHHQWVRPVLVWVRTPPAIVFVIVIPFDFTEGFVNDELAGVFNVTGVINNGRFEIGPLPAFFVEAVGFVADASCFETAGLQVVATPRLNV
jgi:hypothetical protein